MIDTAFLYSLGWTLIHSFWQLSVLALLFFVLMTVLKNHNPSIRYYLSLLFMTISLSLTGVTFIVMYSRFSEVNSVNTFIVNALPVLDFTPGVGQPVSLWKNMTNFIQSNISSLTYFYLIGVCLLMIRMGINYWSLNRLKYRSISIEGDRFEFIRNIIDGMHLKMNVDVRSSYNVNMPMVIGTLTHVAY